jgi:hypothetical protein
MSEVILSFAISYVLNGNFLVRVDDGQLEHRCIEQ